MLYDITGESAKQQYIENIEMSECLLYILPLKIRNAYTLCLE